MGATQCARKTVATALLIQLCLVLEGCASVRIENADVVEKMYPGFVVLSIAPRPDAAVIVRSRGVGLVVGLSGTTLGYMDELAFVTFDPKACSLFIAVETQAQVDSVVKALAAEGQVKDVCVVSKTGEKK
jgi:hypothetical protein